MKYTEGNSTGCPGTTATSEAPSFARATRTKVTGRATSPSTSTSSSIGCAAHDLLHELCHHLDYELLDLEESFHTEGFYKRESNLFHQLMSG